jgi:hypothetical protein
MPVMGISIASLLCITSYAFINGKETLGDNIKKSLRRIDVVLKLVLLTALLTINCVAMAKLLPTAPLGWINISSMIAIIGLNVLTRYFQNKDPDYIAKKIKITAKRIESLQRFQIVLEFARSKILK